MNKAILMGRTTHNLEKNNIKITSTGKKYAFTQIAINENEKDTTFLSLQLWDKQVETFQKYIGKGSLIFVEGKIHNFKKDDKINTYIIANKIEFANLKKPDEVETDL